jgi:hypothetical protein
MALAQVEHCCNDTSLAEIGSNSQRRLTVIRKKEKVDARTR